MEEKIKELKKLGVAYKAALEFDYCPNATEADYIIANLFDHDKDELIKILDIYEGWSCGDIESTTFMKIDEL